MFEKTIWKYIEEMAEQPLIVAQLQKQLGLRTQATVHRWYHETSYPGPNYVKQICQLYNGDEGAMNLFIALKKATPSAQAKFIEILEGL